MCHEISQNSNSGHCHQFVRDIKTSTQNVRAIYVWPLKNSFNKFSLFVLSANGWKDQKHGLFVFPPKKTLIWKRHCSIGQSCRSITLKRSIGWFLESSRAVFSPERSLNQPKATRLCIRSMNQSNRSISFRLLLLFCSHVFSPRSYENRTWRRF